MTKEAQKIKFENRINKLKDSKKSNNVNLIKKVERKLRALEK